ncbi:CLUMA_CG012162, isoform A [Clunio marinus]|uniref:CLUMA_CG012162, isoform A n=1 Tax=Clunio marinus TaxID=568069 RepID=A0A1J1IFL7_9DIPT|nr:CLUMA_CG012162, isoform A [Clunio marinus]
MAGTKDLPALPEGQESYAGIPKAVFVDDVEQFMALPENNFQAEKVLKSLDEQHSKYKFMEMNMIARKRRLRQQLPDLQKSLEMIKILKEQEEDELQTNILLSEQVFVKSVIQKTKTVCLWLGANVMLEYPLDEAEELLKQNLDSASMNLRCLEHDQQSFLSIILLTYLVNFINAMGIKFRWFRHRLTLEQPERVEVSPVLLRTTSFTEYRENCSIGVYHDRQSIFRMPFKNKINFTKPSSRDDTQITTIQQTASTSNKLSEREKEIAMIEKNESLKRKIHEQLQSRNSASMPDLVMRQDLSPKQYRERSVDDYEIQEITQDLQTPKINIVKVQSIEDLNVSAIDNSESSEKPQNFDSNIQIHSNNINNEENEKTFENGEDKKEDKNEIKDSVEKAVKFQEVNSDFYEKTFEAQIEKAESAKSLGSPEAALPPTPMKRKSREDSFEKPRVELKKPKEATINEIVENIEIPTTPPRIKPRTKKLIHRTSSASTTNNVQKIENASNDDDKSIVTNSDNIVADEIFLKVKVKTEVKHSEQSNPNEISEVDSKVQGRKLSVGDVRTFTVVSNLNTDYKNDEEVNQTTDTRFTVEEVNDKLPDVTDNDKVTLKTIEIPVEVFEPLNNEKKNEKSLTPPISVIKKFEDGTISSIEIVDIKAEDEETTNDNLLAPKSILKSTESSVSPVPKKISFHSETQIISRPDSITMSSDSEEDDVWNRVDKHRNQLNKVVADDSDIPPPLPTTPPPSLDDEKSISFA